MITVNTMSLTTTCNDVLTHIILYLDNESCIKFSHTCKWLYGLVHSIHKHMILANDAYEAVRRGLLISFKYHYMPGMGHMCNMKDITDDMLMHMYNVGDTSAVIKLYKHGIFVDAEIHPYTLRGLTMHAVKHNKRDLLDRLKNMCHDDDEFDIYYAYGLIKKGDFAVMKTRYIHDNAFCYYSWSGLHKRMMALYPTITPFGNEFIVQRSPNEFCIIPRIPRCYERRILKNDDVDAYNTIYKSIPSFVDVNDVIKYNAVKIAEHTNILSDIHGKGIYSMVHTSVLNTTIEMAEILLKVFGKNNIKRYFKHTHNPAIIALLKD